MIELEKSLLNHIVSLRIDGKSDQQIKLILNKECLLALVNSYKLMPAD